MLAVKARDHGEITCTKTIKVPECWGWSVQHTEASPDGWKLEAPECPLWETALVNDMQLVEATDYPVCTQQWHSEHLKTT